MVGIAWLCSQDFERNGMGEPRNLVEDVLVSLCTAEGREVLSYTVLYLWMVAGLKGLINNSWAEKLSF